MIKKAFISTLVVMGLIVFRLFFDLVVEWSRQTETPEQIKAHYRSVGY